LLVVAVVVLGAVLGAGPVAFAFHRPWLVAPVALVAFAVAVRSTTILPQQSFHEPGILEFVLTGIRVAALCAAAALTWLALYYAIYWLLRLTNPSANRDPYAFWISFWFGLLSMGALTWLALRKVPAELYPRRPESPRKFETMLKYRRQELLTRLGVGAVILAAVATYAVGFQRNGLALYIVLIGLLMVFGLLLGPADAGGPADEHDLERTLEAALQQAGFRCRHDVKTRDGVAVPNVDLLAEREGASFAVDLVRGAPEEDVEWVAGAGVASATRRLHQQALIGSAMTPVLVLADAGPAGSLQRFCESEFVTLAVVPLAGSADLRIVGFDDARLVEGLRTFQQMVRTGKGRLPPALASKGRGQARRRMRA